MDKNVTKNMAIIVLVIFLCFSIVLNVFFVMRSQELYQREGFFFHIGKSNYNQTEVEYGGFNQLDEKTLSPQPTQYVFSFPFSVLYS